MTSRIAGWMIGIAGVVTLTACGGVKGDYVCQGGLLDTLQLQSGGKAQLTMTYLGQKMQQAGTYTVDGNNVNVVIGNNTAVFVRSGKTLDGGEANGKCTAK